MTTTCARWQGIMSLRGAGQVGADELHSLDDHLRVCARCRDDSRALDQVAAILHGAAHHGLVVTAQSTGAPTPVAPVSRGGVLGDRERGDSARGMHRRAPRIGMAVVGSALATAAAVIVLVLMVTRPVTQPQRAVALSGEPGVVATVDLFPQGGGTQATLHVRGQPAGQVLTVSMKSRSGAWWVSGSYRSAGVRAVQEVRLSCAVAPVRITEVWVTDQRGRVVLDGYVP